MEAFSKILAKVTNCGKQMYHTLNFKLPSRAYLILLGERMIALVRKLGSKMTLYWKLSTILCLYLCSALLLLTRK